MAMYIEPEINMETVVSLEHAWLRSRGTIDHISNIQWMMELARKHQRNSSPCFIDYSKTPDSVNHDILWINMKCTGIPEHLVTLTKNVYENQEQCWVVASYSTILSN